MLTKVIMLRIALYLVFPHEDVFQNTDLAQSTSENLSYEPYGILLEIYPYMQTSVNVTRVHSLNIC